MSCIPRGKLGRFRVETTTPVTKNWTRAFNAHNKSVCPLRVRSKKFNSNTLSHNFSKKSLEFQHMKCTIKTGIFHIAPTCMPSDGHNFSSHRKTKLTGIGHCGEHTQQLHHLLLTQQLPSYYSLNFWLLMAVKDMTQKSLWGCLMTIFRVTPLCITTRMQCIVGSLYAVYTTDMHLVF